ncbi:COG1470 family protein [Agromyces bauzanensis]
MAERTCETCGAKNDVDARFCATCDAYLGWDVGRSTLGGDALTGTIPRVVGTVPTDTTATGTTATDTTETTATGSAEGSGAPAASGTSTDAWAVDGSGAVTEPALTTPAATADEPATTAAAEPEPPDSEPSRFDPPDVDVVTPEVTIATDVPARVELSIENSSTIVDGYVIEAVDPPAWLELTHPDTHLMPGERRTVPVSLAMRPGVLVLAQRLTLTFLVRSMEDPRLTVDAGVHVTVPPRGPRVSLEARPTLIRLEDSGSGSLSLRLDNRGANYPQTFGLSGGDPESVVRFAFTPEVVEVPAGAMVEAAVTFAAPLPAPGQQLNRQLTVTATNDEGPITAIVTLVQHTASAPVDQPIRVRLQPSTLRLADAYDADFDVHIDNRGGHNGVTVALAGNDPEHRLAFAFAPARFLAVPGHITRAHGRVRANLPPKGTTATHPFTVVASDGTTDVEASGVLEISSSAAAITTAELQVEPPKLNVGTRREGRFSVIVDNRRGAEPLHVTFSARSEDGLARATFAPPQLAVGPGAVGQAQLTVSSPRPPANQVGVRRLEVEATAGAQSLSAAAELTQTAPNRRGPASKWLVIIGAILVAIGTLNPWFAFYVPFLDFFQWIGFILSTPVELSMSMDQEVVRSFIEPPLRYALVALALAMAFGMAGGSGGLTRKSAILIVLLTVAFLVLLLVVSSVPELAFGIPIIWVGAVLGYIGGVLARPRPAG